MFLKATKNADIFVQTVPAMNVNKNVSVKRVYQSKLNKYWQSAKMSEKISRLPKTLTT